MMNPKQISNRLACALRNSKLPRLFLLLSLLLSACSTPFRRAAVPHDMQSMATISGMPDIRYWEDETSDALRRDSVEAMQREQKYLAKNGYNGALPPADFLAISGGGDNGAFGTGVLVGWTKTGTRPQFTVVPGISTGALMAPFAFLGPEYDAVLKKLYTSISTKDVLQKRSIVNALFNDALTDNAPLFRLLEKYITPEMLAAIAMEHEKGRILLIGTTDLDAQRGVVWNIGKIAASGNPHALDLVRRILLASAAIPGIFPPTLLDVEAGGKQYQEMHVDGGTTAQVFLYPPSFEVDKRARQRRLYIIRNARLDPNWAEVNPRTLTIMGRAITSLIQTQGIGNLYNMYLSALRDGIDYQLAFIPESFKEPHTEPFNNHYMRKLYEVGYQMAVTGYPWEKLPPGYVESKVARHENNASPGAFSVR